MCTGSRDIFIGVGGGGCSIVGRAYLDSCIEGPTVAINTDSDGLRRCSVKKKVLIGAQSCRGRGCYGDSFLGRLAVFESRETLENLIVGHERIVLFAGLGGGTGTGATPEIGRIAGGLGLHRLAVVMMPFSFEGRGEVAKAGRTELVKYTEEVVAVDLQQFIQRAPQNTRMCKIICQAQQALLDLLKKKLKINEP